MIIKKISGIILLNDQAVLGLLLMLVSFLVFSIALIDQSEMYLKSAVVTIAILAVYFSLKKSSFSALFVLLFSIFFVLPFVILGDGFLKNGTFYNFTLSESGVLRMLSHLYFFLFVFSGLTLMTKSVSINYQASEGSFTLTKFYHIFLFATGVYMIVFNIREAFYVWDQGYITLVGGAGNFKKHIVEFFVEILFLCLVIIGLKLKDRSALLMLILYSVSWMLGGQRMPGFMMLVVLWVFIRPTSFRGVSVLFYIVVAFFFAVPLLHIIAALRTGGFELLSEIDLWYSYEDIWHVIGFSFDTLKAAFFYDGQFKVSITPFAKLFQVFSVFMGRVFDMPMVFDQAGFAGEFSRNFNPSDYELKGVTFGSSGIAEAYFFFGTLGAPIYALIVFNCCRIFDWCLLRNSFISLAVLFFFAPKFFVAVRNELFGWLWEGSITFSVFLVVYLICKPFFVSTLVHNRPR